MGIGTSLGAYYDDDHHYNSVLWDPKRFSGDEMMEKSPSGMMTDKKLDQAELDPSTGMGIEVSNRIYVSPNKDSDPKLPAGEETPLGGSTEPAGALNQEQGTLTASPEQKLQGGFLKALTGTENPRPITDILIDFAKEKASHLIDALKAPGDAWAGNLDPMSPQGLERAQTLAGLMVMGPAPVASKLADGTLGSFAGVKAKGAPLEDLKLAQKIEEVGGDSDLIWQKTGWFKGADGRWKFEIPDQESRLNPTHLEMTPYSKEKMENLDKAWFRVPEGKTLSLPDILQHPELYQAYPHLKNVKVIPVDAYQQLAGVKGYFNGDLALAPGSLSELRSVALHEIQHAIQSHEGFSYGASDSALASPRWKGLNSEFTTYKREAEANISRKLRDENVIHSVYDFKNAIKNEDKLPAEGEKYSDWTSTWTKEENAKARKLIKMAKDLGIYDELKKINKGENIQTDYGKLLFDEYERVKGEVEARNVQTRRDLSYFDRYQRSPESTEDIPRDKQRWSPYDSSSLKDLQ